MIVFVVMALYMGASTAGVIAVETLQNSWTGLELNNNNNYYYYYNNINIYKAAHVVNFGWIIGM